MDNGLTILLLCGLAWMWWDGRGVAEHAIRAVKNHCEQIASTPLRDPKIKQNHNRV